MSPFSGKNRQEAITMMLMLQLDFKKVKIPRSYSASTRTAGNHHSADPVGTESRKTPLPPHRVTKNFENEDITNTKHPKQEYVP